MRKLLLIASALVLATSANAAPYTLYASSPPAGQPIRMTVNRSDTSKADSVILSTKDNTAKVNTDYDFTSVLVNFAPQQVSATILIPTHVTTTAYGQTLKVGLVVSSGSTPVASMLASIIEPNPPQYALAPITELGLVRCKNTAGCATSAQFGEVRVYRWNGVDNLNNVIGVYWPIGHVPIITKAASDWYLGIEGPLADWEGVKQA
jgi:hypothetical protein